ncbi:putative AAA domain protein [uncultured Dysgonomonas sp.]|uniref:Putative AAA domain protein n=1 Tax=uncultured Dysgonomonas sp. TaxID=206096 RepID=A0A212J087_9BACT|nr:AAA family ATPase [uncultured Dysgonomonas sp.]SBV92866.1 putative AAA domain protein [uncultured Dysgonomonas sp.]
MKKGYICLITIYIFIMLRKFDFRNYKAFDQGSIELKPITILLGANSSGKSSLLQLLLLFEQTLNTERGYESALKLNGKYTSLGETENIFKNKDLDKKLSFAFEIEFDSLHEYFRETRNLKRFIERDIDDMHYEFKKIEAKLLTRDYRFRTRTLSSDANFLNYVKDIKKIKKEILNNYPKENVLFEELSSEYEKEKLFSENPRLKRVFNKELNEYIEAYQALESLSNLKIRKFVIEYGVHYNKKHNTLDISSVSIRNNDVLLIEYKIERNKGHKKFILTSEILNNRILNKYRITFGRNTDFEALDLVPKDRSEDTLKYNRGYIGDSIFCSMLIRFINIFSSSLHRSFSNSRINYISPLRAFPKRYYFLDESNVSSSLDSIDGDNLTEILKKEHRLTQKVNKWLNNFELSVSIEDVKEVIHRLKVTQNGLSLDITDVGFGISQVLPIIVQGFLSKNESITIIEQPEIHLHPKMQAELADLFIDVITSDENNKALLIETHSESILKRLRRRIAEGKISNEDVAIYFIHSRQKKSSSAKVERLAISNTGAFDWPKEFYSTDLEDTTEYLKYQ